MHLCMENVRNVAEAISLQEVFMDLTYSVRIQFVAIVPFVLRLSQVIFMQQCM